VDDVSEMVAATPSDVFFLGFVQELYGGCDYGWGAGVRF
jgi:hypothetical protein